MKRTGRILALTAVILLASAGCEVKPRAPVLRDDPVYQNDQVGIRFEVPEGWVQYANSMIPPGKLTKARLAVAYGSTQYRGAAFEVSVIDIAPDADRRAIAAEPTHGVKEWTAQGEPEPTTVGGRDGRRYRFSGKSGSENLIKEVTLFQHGDRVVFFLFIADPADSGAKAAVRRSLETVTWRN